MKPKKAPRSHKELLLLAALASVVLWMIPGGHVVALPFLYLNTILHEIGHAVAALATGGYVHSIGIHANGSGVTLTAGGWGMAISSAGYVGASVLGAIFIAKSRTPAGAQAALAGMGVALIVALILWIRGDAVGLLMTVLWIFGLMVAARKLRGEGAVFFAQFLGLQQCLNAFHSLLVLLRINAVPGLENDAAIAARQIGLPPMVFAVSWCLLSLALMGLAFRKGWSASSSSRAG